jgi:hypothetical protein
MLRISSVADRLSASQGLVSMKTFGYARAITFRRIAQYHTRISRRLNGTAPYITTERKRKERFYYAVMESVRMTNNQRDVGYCLIELLRAQYFNGNKKSFP